MKIQLGANAVVVESSALNRRNPAAIKSVLACPKGKAKMLEISLTDDNGQVCIITAPLRQFKSGGIGAYLSMKCEARIVTVEGTDAAADAAAKDAAKMDALTRELLGK